MPNKRKDDDVNNDKESVSSVSSTLRASKRSRNSLSTAKAGLNTSNDMDDTNDSAETGSVQAVTLPRAAKRSRSSTLNKSQMNSSNEIEEPTPTTPAQSGPSRKAKAAVSTAAPVVGSASTDSNVNLFLEDLFDIFCSYQDENHRFLATIFYILPSKKVTTQGNILTIFASIIKTFIILKRTIRTIMRL
jgi:hypothetical protein